MAEFRQDTTYEYSGSAVVMAVSQSQGAGVVGWNPLEGPTPATRVPRFRSAHAPRGLALRGGERSEHPMKVFTYQVRREGPGPGLQRPLFLKEGPRKRSRCVDPLQFNLTLRDNLDGTKTSAISIGSRYSSAKLELSLYDLPRVTTPSPCQPRKGAVLRSAPALRRDRRKGSVVSVGTVKERRRRVASNKGDDDGISASLPGAGDCQGT